MKLYSILVFLLITLSFQVFSRVIVENGTLIDAENPVRVNMTLVLKGDEIAYIGKTSLKEISIREDDNVIDATGKFIIPGLWDAHVHLTFIPELDYQTAYKLFLKNGITSIRDTGAVIEKLRPAIEFAEDNPSKAPRLFYSGPLIDGIPRVYKGSEPGFPELSIGVNKDTDNSIHLEKFAQIPLKWQNQGLNNKWIKIKKIRDVANISIENKRANKDIGSSLEANVKIKLNKELFKIAKSFDFAEICITSGAEIILDENINDEINVETIKAEGEKCKVCWKIKIGKCERHG